MGATVLTLMKNIALLIAAGFLLAGCSKSSEPKVEAEVHVDTDKTAKDVNAALDKAGSEIKKGAEAAKDKLEDAGHAIKKSAEDVKDKLTDDKKIEVEVKTK